MRVAYIVLAPFVSGAERSLQTTLQFLPQCGIEPVVVCPPDSKIIPWCECHQVPFVLCPLAFRDKWHPFRWWGSVRKMQSLLRSESIDVVHSNQVWSYPAAGAAGRDLGLPRVCHMRDEVSPQAVRWCCASGVEQVVCISRHIERQVQRAWPFGDTRPAIRTMVNPVVFPELPSGEQQKKLRQAARRQFGMAEDRVVFGFIGQIVPVKGLLNLLDALHALADDPRWQLLVAGRDPHPGAPHEAVCREHARSLALEDRVKFCGFLENVEAFYQAIDVAVVPSLEEPLGRIPLEAASYAKPTIAFAVGGLPETIVHNETGWLVPSGDQEALRQTLSHAMDKPLDVVGASARELVERISDPNAYVEELARIYAGLTSSAPVTVTGNQALSRAAGERVG